MLNPLVSIVLPTYNGEKYIKEAINAIINQTYKNWELIVVNDCSTDSTLKIVNEYTKKDTRIRVISNETNKKVPASLNIGFNEAKGEYYTWTSDDNYYYPNAIEKMINFLENNQEYGMVYTSCDILSINKKTNKITANKPPKLESFLEGNIFGACFLYRKNVAKSIGKYSEKWHLADDYDYFLRIALRYKIANLNEVLYAYRKHPNALTAKHMNESALVAIKITTCYQNEFLEKFPNNQEMIKRIIGRRIALLNKDEKELINLLKSENKKILYREAKCFFKSTQDKFYLNLMKKLGGFYFFKALKQELIEYISHRKMSFYPISIRRYGDNRGFLTTLEENTDVPFKIKRTYYLSEISKGHDRAHHAHKHSKRVLSAIQGSVKATLFDGKNKETFTLDNPNKGVYFSNKVWCELSDFKDNAIVLALASEKYYEKEYIRSYDEFINYINKRKNKWK